MKVTSLKPLPGYRLQLAFADGAQGTVDLSAKVGRGVFGIWKTAGVFEQAKIGASGGVEWPGEVDLCPDTLYQLATGHLSAEFSPKRELIAAWERAVRSEQPGKIAPLP